MRLSRLLAALAVTLAARPTPAQAPAHVTLRVENPLAITRRDETVSVPWTEVMSRLAGVTPTTVRVRDAEGREIPSQVVDNEGVGTPDALIFQGDFREKEVRHFTAEAAAPSMPYEPRVAGRAGEPRRRRPWGADPPPFRNHGDG